MEAGYHGNFLYDTLIDMYVKRDSAGMISDKWRKLDTSNLISLCVAIHQEEGYEWYTVEFVHLKKNGHAFAKSKGILVFQIKC